MLRLLAAATLLCSASVMAADEASARVEALAALAVISQNSGGTLGVSALRVKTGERLQYNADQRFPMASTFKVPLALALLDQVDRKKVSLDRKVQVDSNNLSPGSGELNKDLDPGESRASSVGDLLELTIRNSDNTATDHLLAMVGGPKVVTSYLRGLGVGAIDVNRPAAQLVADSWGFKLPPPGERTRKNLVRALNTTPQAAREKAAQRFLADPRDTTTPDAMVAVLERLVTGKAVSAASAAVLIDHMEKCRTGPRRMKYEFPKGMTIAHKTGTLTRVATNDVGMITLPWGNGSLVIAIYLRGSNLPLAQQESAVARAALATYRYFNR